MALSLRHVALCSVAIVAAACSKKTAPEPSLPDTAAPAAAPAPFAAPEPAPVATPAGIPGPVETAEFVAETVYFDFDSFTVKAGELEKIRKLAATIKNFGAPVTVQIEGHCDERGSNEYNLALGERRARAIQDALIAEGVASSNLTTISYGEERPSIEGQDEAAFSKNRRGEFKKL